MAVAWLVWPIVLLMSILGQSLWRVLHRWGLILAWFLLGYLLSFVALMILAFIPPDRARTLAAQRFPNPVRAELDFAYTIRWWHRLEYLGVTRLLPDGWITAPAHQGRFPADKDVMIGFLHVSLAGSLTIVSAIVAVLFLRALIATCRHAVQPYPGGLQP